MVDFSIPLSGIQASSVRLYEAAQNLSSSFGAAQNQVAITQSPAIYQPLVTEANSLSPSTFSAVNSALALNPESQIINMMLAETAFKANVGVLSVLEETSDSLFDLLA